MDVEDGILEFCSTLLYGACIQPKHDEFHGRDSLSLVNIRDNYINMLETNYLSSYSS